ncbi:MAG TPA: PQQ-dependent dehydrogenase, methanol/ethanol family [Candidatus Acidoferrales bacterium]
MKLVCGLVLCLVASAVAAQVSYQQIRNAKSEPQNWLTYSGGYAGLRYSTLDQITPANAKNLEIKWIFQADSVQKLENTPLVVNGVLYLTQPPNDIIAMDAKTGRVFWTYHFPVPTDAHLCCGLVNRGLAILGNTLFMGTVNGHLVAVDAKDGHQLWDVQLGDNQFGYGITEAPLVVKDKVIVAMAGAESGIRGFVAAFSAETGEQEWKFYTVPGPGESGNETWKGESWQRGGGSSWMTGSYDPDLNLVFWGIGNPWPDYDPEIRAGDDLYTDSAIALDPDTGKLKWYFQFTPNDRADFDAIQVPVLTDMDWQGSKRKVILWANRNGFFYVLDRATGKFLRGNPFVKVTWARGLDANGRPIRAASGEGTLAGNQVFPGIQGGTNWYSPSYSPKTGLFYVTAWQDYSAVYLKQPSATGAGVVGTIPRSPLPNLARGPLNTWTEEVGHGEVQAIDPRTGEKKWVFKMNDVSDSGILTTASNLLFTGSREGYFQVLDDRTGKLLWRATLGGQLAAAPMTYEVDGKQYVAMSGGHALFVFGLRDQRGQ